jgi:uncharacterized protein (DUF1501 family)
MMLISRRSFALGTLLGCGSTVFDRVAHALPNAQRPGRPRALVQVLLRGGMDQMLTTDPKTPREVVSRIPIPYSESDIRMIGGGRFGPNVKPIERWLPRATVLNGILCSTVSHPAGEQNIHEMRRQYPRDAGIGLAGTIGTLLRGKRPLADVRLDLNGDHHRPVRPVTRSLILRAAGEEGPVQSLFDVARSSSKRSALDQALGESARSCASQAACTSIDAVRDLLRAMPDHIERVPEIPDGLGVRQNRLSASMWRDILFLLEHELTASVFVVPHFVMWDSHQYNSEWQAKAMDLFGWPFAWFLDQLQTRKTADGMPLADQVGVIVSSELGRFPIPNELQGKDHLPEFPAMLWGPGLRQGQFGQTDKDCLSVPIGLASGHAGTSATRTLIPTIDDLGATILHWFGIEDAASLGYVGRRLDFLLA